MNELQPTIEVGSQSLLNKINSALAYNLREIECIRDAIENPEQLQDVENKLSKCLECGKVELERCNGSGMVWVSVDFLSSKNANGAITAVTHNEAFFINSSCNLLLGTFSKIAELDRNQRMLVGLCHSLVCLNDGVYKSLPTVVLDGLSTVLYKKGDERLQLWRLRSTMELEGVLKELYSFREELLTLRASLRDVNNRVPEAGLSVTIALGLFDRITLAALDEQYCLSEEQG